MIIIISRSVCVDLIRENYHAARGENEEQEERAIKIREEKILARKNMLKCKFIELVPRDKFLFITGAMFMLESPFEKISLTSSRMNYENIRIEHIKN